MSEATTGPCLTPDEVQAREAAAEMRWREAAKALCEESHALTGHQLSACIAALPPPAGASALDAVVQRAEAAERALRLVLVMAPSFQGGHSGTGGEVADFLGIPFPIKMPALAKAAKARGFSPDTLWPWWKKMRQERAAAKAAHG